MISLLVLLLSSQAFAWTANSPSAGPSLVPGGQLRVFVDYHRLSLYSETQSRLESGGAIHQSTLAGLYAQPWDWMRMGAFIQLQRGVRHDADWNWSDALSAWAWDNVNTRLETLLVLDASPRMLLPWMPGESWVGELKVRYFYNYFNREQTITVRPGFSYFWLKNGEPFWNFFAQYEAYIPLNYGGGALVYDHWIYLSALKPLSRAFQLGAPFSYRIQDWASTSFYTNNTTPASRYFVAEGSFHIGLLALIRLGIE